MLPPGSSRHLVHAVEPSDHRLVFLRRIALLCAIVVLSVTSLSAYLRLTKAGLGCADWPQCYGQAQRQAQQGLAVSTEEQTTAAGARLAHRVAAVAALLLIVTMVMVCFGSRPMLRREGATALALLGLALFLAVLGRWSSGSPVPAVTIGNLLGGFAMLALAARLAAARRIGPPPWPRGLVWAVMLMVLAQLMLGGLVSATYAGLSCSGWIECIEAARGSDWAALNPLREPLLGRPPAVNPAGALVQVLHRGLGAVLLVAGLILAAVVLGCGRARLAAALLILFSAQAAVGFVMATASLPLALALLHNVLAAGLLTTLALLV